MKAYNEQVVKLFNQYADLLEIAGENPFRIRAYREAARSISNLSKNIADLIDQEFDLKKLPHIGEDLSQKIITIIKTGEFPALKKIQKHYPLALCELMKIEGLGARRVRILYDELHIESFDDLKKAIQAEKLKNLKGFGKNLEEKIKTSLEHKDKYALRVILIYAMNMAKPLIAYLKKLPGILEIEVAGSYRRRKETVGDLDILIISNKKIDLKKDIVAYPKVQEVLASGETKTTVRLQSGIHVDLRVIPPESKGAALLYFTGSLSHNLKLRQMAQERGLKINEYGLFKKSKPIAQKTELEMYRAMGLDYVEPELREDHGEIAAAENHQLPKLISFEDIQGDLHSHTKASDGINTLEEMANAAISLGYKYLAITEHSKRLTIANGLDEKRLLKHIDAIDELNTKFKNFTLLKSIEVDILEDGTLDLPDNVLKRLDLTVCSIHSHFNLSSEKQTERIIRAMHNSYFKVLGHPTGRLINKRKAYQFNLEKVMETAKEQECFLEMNAQPARLDLNEIHCKMAKEMGIKLAISSDAHSTSQLNFLRFGIYQARRGWLEKKDVINTLSLPHLKKILKKD
jgi:DNA polymerase (family 10)